MFTKTIALTGAFAALAAAVPNPAKRDLVWVTETQEAVVTVPVTTTVWVDGATPTHYGHQHSHKSYTKTVRSTVTASLAPSSSKVASIPTSQTSSSVYVAPTTSSVYVAPTTISSVYVAPTTSSSVYVAPTTSSSVYVAPTTSSSVYVAPTSSSSAYVAPTTSSVYVAPTTSTSVYVAPTTSSVYVASTTAEASVTTTAAAPTYSSSSSSSGSGLSYGLGESGTSYSGDLTYFAVGLGACGEVSTESDKMVAISEKIFDSYLSEAGGNPNKNPLCGKSITITGADGSPYTAQIWDRCPGCDEASLDLPQAFFNTVTYNPSTGTSGDGRVHSMKWSFD